MASEADFALFDRASGNQLGEFRTFEEAEETLLRYVRASPRSAADLEISHEDGRRLRVDPQKLRAITAA